MPSERTRSQIAKLIRSKRGLLLDVSFGGTPQANSLSLVADLKCSPLKARWPLPAGSVHTSVVTHVLEFIPPEQFFAWFDELHRVTRTGGICYVSGPYGGDESQGWLSDPSHRTRIVEQSFAWLDPRTPFYELNAARGRKPKPWNPLTVSRIPGTHGTISYNVTLQAK